jgi:hypothetical protein
VIARNMQSLSHETQTELSLDPHTVFDYNLLHTGHASKSGSDERKIIQPQGSDFFPIVHVVSPDGSSTVSTLTYDMLAQMSPSYNLNLINVQAQTQVHAETQSRTYSKEQTQAIRSMQSKSTKKLEQGKVHTQTQAIPIHYDDEDADDDEMEETGNNDNNSMQAVISDDSCKEEGLRSPPLTQAQCDSYKSPEKSSQNPGPLYLHSPGLSPIPASTRDKIESNSTPVTLLSAKEVAEDESFMDVYVYSDKKSVNAASNSNAQSHAVTHGHRMGIVESQMLKQEKGDGNKSDTSYLVPVYGLDMTTSVIEEGDSSLQEMPLMYTNSAARRFDTDSSLRAMSILVDSPDSQWPNTPTKSYVPQQQYYQQRSDVLSSAYGQNWRRGSEINRDGVYANIPPPFYASLPKVHIPLLSTPKDPMMSGNATSNRYVPHVSRRRDVLNTSTVPSVAGFGSDRTIEPFIVSYRTRMTSRYWKDRLASRKLTSCI